MPLRVCPPSLPPSLTLCLPPSLSLSLTSPSRALPVSLTTPLSPPLSPSPLPSPPLPLPPSLFLPPSLSVTNGLRPPTQPSVSNGAVVFLYSYTVSDGVSYSVSANLTVTTSSAFATLTDALQTPYQQVVNLTGTRQYTCLLNQATVLSAVTGLSTAIYASPDQRFMPYALLSSAPGVYSMSTAPFLDFTGLEFSVSPAVPANGGLPGIQPLYSASRVYLSTPEPSAMLVEAQTSNPKLPLVALQQQLYTVASP